ncbi:hypothetical protein MKZ38_000216 [Zalerion maritima]|uniref:Uncharacterized protein n=1 Tax=Zalerion maritima TaxID=339359 RepID=A0AAD5RRR0_9PEZI|nr:hypothetical protein MKZ38_000216 [Zalerion maritima]
MSGFSTGPKPGTSSTRVRQQARHEPAGTGGPSSTQNHNDDDDDDDTGKIEDYARGLCDGTQEIVNDIDLHHLALYCSKIWELRLQADHRTFQGHDEALLVVPAEVAETYDWKKRGQWKSTGEQTAQKALSAFVVGRELEFKREFIRLVWGFSTTAGLCDAVDPLSPNQIKVIQRREMRNIFNSFKNQFGAAMPTNSKLVIRIGQGLEPWMNIWAEWEGTNETTIMSCFDSVYELIYIVAFRMLGHNVLDSGGKEGDEQVPDRFRDARPGFLPNMSDIARGLAALKRTFSRRKNSDQWDLCNRILNQVVREMDEKQQYLVASTFNLRSRGDIAT